MEAQFYHLSLIQTALEKGGAPEQLKTTDDITVWGSETNKVFYPPQRGIQILLKAGFTIKKSKVKGSGTGDSILGNKMAEWMLSCTYGCGQRASNYVSTS